MKIAAQSPSALVLPGPLPREEGTTEDVSRTFVFDSEVYSVIYDSG